MAAGAARVRTLDEHFRCAPHLIDFIGQRLYGGAFTVATRSPRTERCDCIEVGFRVGARDRRGAVMSEVERVIATLRDLEAAGERSVGVVTPFRAHADAIEEAVLAAFTVDELERLDLRVGTVHAFQGNERDVIVLALGIGTGEVAGSWRFVEERHLFAVMMTRARRRLIVAQSAPPPAQGLLHDYLAQADCPTGRPAPAGHLSAFAEGLAVELAAAGLDVARAYPTGRHVVDIAIGGGSAPMAVICGIHRDGPVAHVDRHLALRRSGWEVVEALPEGWGARRSQLVVELAGRLTAPSGGAGSPAAGSPAPADSPSLT